MALNELFSMFAGQGKAALAAAAVIPALAVSGEALAQSSGLSASPAPQAAVSVGASSTSDSYFDMQGISWSLAGPNWFARFGPRPPGVSPAFGNFPGDAGGSLGLGLRGGRIQGEFFGRWSQGHRSTATFQSPSLMLSDGTYGWWWDMSATPFVVGATPVLGDRPFRLNVPSPFHAPQSGVLERSQSLAAATSPQQPGPDINSNVAPEPGGEDRLPAPDRLTSQQEPAQIMAPTPASGASDNPIGNTRLESTSTGGSLTTLADHGVGSEASASPWSTATTDGLSVQEAERLHATETAARNREAESLLNKARAALNAGKVGLAAVYCRMALNRSTGEVRRSALEIQRRITAIESRPH